MRRVVLYGFVLVCLTAVSFLGVTPLERKTLNPDGTTALSAPVKAAQVEVTNFPAVQAVSGTVNVANLPVDADGNLRVTCQAPVPSYRYFKLADNLSLPVGPAVILDPIQVGGWQHIELTLDIKDGPNGAGVIAYFGGNGVFPTNSAMSFGWSELGAIAARGDVRGPEMKVVIYNTNSLGPVLVDLWVYLSN